jgi:hypothetical protein
MRCVSASCVRTRRQTLSRIAIPVRNEAIKDVEFLLEPLIIRQQATQRCAGLVQEHRRRVIAERRQGPGCTRGVDVVLRIVARLCPSRQRMTDRLRRGTFGIRVDTLSSCGCLVAGLGGEMSSSDAERESELRELLAEVRALRSTIDELKATPGFGRALPPDYAVLVRATHELPPDYAVAVRTKPALPPDYAVLVRPQLPPDYAVLVRPELPPDYEVLVRPVIPGEEESPIAER